MYGQSYVLDRDGFEGVDIGHQVWIERWTACRDCRNKTYFVFWHWPRNTELPISERRRNPWHEQ